MSVETTNVSSVDTEENSKSEERKNRLLNDFHVDEDHWNKIGFWCALHENDQRAAFDNVLTEQKIFHQEQREKLLDNHNIEVERYKNKISEAKAEAEKLDDALQKHKDVSELATEIRLLRADIVKIEESLITSYQKLGEAKKNLIQNQIEEVFADLDKITERYNNVSEQHNSISEKAKERNADALNIKPLFLKGLRDSYKTISENLHDRLESLSKNGVSFVTRSRLVGYGTTLAAGWFFSVFALGKGIGNKDVPFFLITGLFGFGDNLSVDGSFYLSLLNHVIFLIVVLVSMFLVTMLCNRLMDKNEKRQLLSKLFLGKLLGENKNNSDDDSQSDDKQLEKEINSTGSQATSKAFLTFWLESMPLLLLFGITFIVISLGNVSPEELEKLNNSLSAQTVGTALAIGCGGLTYLYIVNIIEPRLESKRNRASNWLYANLELVIVILTITSLFIFLLFGVENTLYQSSNNLFSFIMFLICVLLSSMTIGYATYYLGLIETVNYIESRMQNLSIITAYNSFPNIRLIMRADRTFRQSYIDVVEKLLKLELNKTRLSGRFFSLNDQSTQQKQQRAQDKFSEQRPNNIWKGIKGFFASLSPKGRAELLELTEQEKKDEAKRQVEKRFETLPEDKEYFPQITCEIENLKGRRNSQSDRVIELEEESKKRKQESTDYAKKLHETINDLKGKISNWQKYVSVLLDIQLRELSVLFEKQSKTIAQIQDGFNLGRWFTEYGVMPMSPAPERKVEDANPIQ